MTNPKADQIAEYVRTRGGRMVHRKGCRKLVNVKHAHPWEWANGRDLMWVEACLEWNGVGGIDFCKTCCPEVFCERMSTALGLHNDGPQRSWDTDPRNPDAECYRTLNDGCPPENGVTSAQNEGTS